MAKITKEIVATVVLTLNEWDAIKAMLEVFGKQPLGTPGYQEFVAANDVARDVHHAKQGAGLN